MRLQRILKIGIFGLGGALLALLLLLAWWFTQFDYPTFTNYILEQFNQPHLRATFERILPADRFSLLQNLVWLLPIMSVVVLTFLWWKYPRYSSQFKEFSTAIKRISTAIYQQFSTLPILEKRILIFILALSTILNIWRCASYPFLYDEIWTFLYFTRQLPFISLVIYPAPNNHILFSFLTSLSHFVGCADLWSLRWLNALVYPLNILIFWLLHCRLINRKSAIWGTILFAFALPIAFYATYGRGYQLLLLFFLINLLTLSYYKVAHWRKASLVIFTLSGIAGFYTIPTFLYAYAILGGTFLLTYRHWNDWWQLIKISLFIAIVVVILYSPIYLIYGSFGNLSDQLVTIVMSTPLMWWSKTAEYMLKVLRFLGANQLWGVLLFLNALVCSSYFFNKRRYRFLSYLTWTSLLLPIIAFSLQSVAIPERTWIFICVPLSINGGWLLHQFAISIQSKWITIIPIPLLTILFIYFQNNSAYWSGIYQNTVSCQRTAIQLSKSGNRSYFINNESIKPFLTYYHLEQSPPPTIKMTQRSSVDYHQLTAMDKFDILIFTTKEKLPEMPTSFWKNYQEIESDVYRKVFKYQQ
ncbi:MAG: hypothetical protein AB8G22_18360 [Saprospiraceae bacterium]